MRLKLATRELAEGDDVIVLRLRSGAPRLAALRWGMLAPWTGHGGKRGPVRYLAPVAAIATTTNLRSAFEKRRCIVLADGALVTPRRGSGKSQPYWLHLRTGHPLGLAAIWNVHKDDGRESVALVVTTAPPALAPFTDVVPLLVEPTWLSSLHAARDAVADPTQEWRADLASAVGSAQGELF